MNGTGGFPSPDPLMPSLSPLALQLQWQVAYPPSKSRTGIIEPVEVEEDEELPEGALAHVFTHKRFSLSYNGDRIIQVNLTSENPVPIQPGV